MRKWKFKYVLLLLIVCSHIACKKTYAPPETNVNHLFLVVDGLINTSAASVSSIKLTRSQTLSDTVPEIPEKGATVSIRAVGGGSYSLTDTGSNGVYTSDSLTLDNSRQYILAITTSDGKKYETDPVTPRVAPPIDSVSWTLGYDGAADTDAVNIYVNTQDPTNKSRFYRWDFTETWEYQATYKIFYTLINYEALYVSDSTQHPWYCWRSANSTNILLGSSAGLSADVISEAPIARIYKNDPRMDIKYSILVRQYVLESPAYDYWLLVQKTSQSLGGLFDIQPAQFIGNVHSLDAPGESVYGWVSASAAQEKRIFISHADLPDWKSVSTLYCPKLVNPPDRPEDLYYYKGFDPNFTFFGLDQSTPPNQLLVPTDCIDCRRQGGSTTKPPFWQ
jgi:Domain of unknown function (DUF4249)